MGIANLKLEIQKVLFLVPKEIISKNISTNFSSQCDKIREEKDKARDP